jgi:DNA-binding GntR family transcriptional regulator
MPDDSLLITRIPESLRTQVVERLRWAICQQRFPQGSRLVERTLCEMLGVSRTLVREALRQLEAEGFVVSAGRQGPTVASLDRDTVRGIYEVRAVLEALAGELFVQRATATHRSHLEEAFTAMRTAQQRPEPGSSLDQTARFYDAIFAGAQNEIIAATLRPLSGRIYLLRARSMSIEGRRLESHQEMTGIYEALCGNDPALAWSRCRQHVTNASVYALRTFEEPAISAIAPLRRRATPR